MKKLMIIGALIAMLAIIAVTGTALGAKRHSVSPVIVAMGTIGPDATVYEGYNVDNCTWNASQLRYQITITGVSYSISNYVTLVAPINFGSATVSTYTQDGSGNLLVYMYDVSNNIVQAPFSFMVLANP